MATKTKRTGKRKRPITAEDLLRIHWLADAQMAPNGQRIVFVKKHVGDKNRYVRDLWMVDTDGASEPRRFTAGGSDVCPRWSPDGRQLAFIGGRDEHRPQIYLIAADGGEASPLTDLPEGSFGTLRWSPDGARIGFTFRPKSTERTDAAARERAELGLSQPPLVIEDITYREDGDGYFGADRHRLYVAEVTSGTAVMVFDKDPTGHVSFDFSPDGGTLAIGANPDRRAATRPWLAGIFTFDLRRRRLRRIEGLPEGPKEAVTWSPDGRLLAFAGRVGESGPYSTENLELMVCDPKLGGARSLTGGEDYCLLAATASDSAEVDFAPRFQFSPSGKRIFMRLGWHGETHIASVATRGGAIVLHTSGVKEHDLGGISADGRSIATIVSSPLELGEIHVAEAGPTKSLALRRLTQFNRPLLAELELSKPKMSWVSTADGTRVQVWSIRPVGHKGKRRVPAVLEIHGGPHAQYGVSFFHELQLLAASGYGVFYSNPRGSKGYGAAHCRAIHGNWGSADWVDIQAVTKAIQETPWVDPARIGIMGGSYGGYMTNWAIGHSRAYRAAITDRCVSNLVSMQGNSDFAEEPGHYFPGNFWDDADELWRQSPLKYFGKVRTPTLIIHSEGDLRCNIEQAEQIFTALKLRNIPTRFVRYPSSTSHGMSRGGPPDLRLHRLQQILAWWRRYLA